jgi:hypothetical protein
MAVQYCNTPSALWVISAGMTVGPPLPVYPDEWTSSERPGRSGSCQQRKSADLFDHFVGAAALRLTTNSNFDGNTSG